MLSRWTPSIDDVAADPTALAQFIAHLAADGLWMYESLTNRPLPPDARRLVADHIARAMKPTSTQGT